MGQQRLNWLRESCQITKVGTLGLAPWLLGWAARSFDFGFRGIYSWTHHPNWRNSHPENICIYIYMCVSSFHLFRGPLPFLSSIWQWCVPLRKPNLLDPFGVIKPRGFDRQNNRFTHEHCSEFSAEPIYMNLLIIVAVGMLKLEPEVYV